MRSVCLQSPRAVPGIPRPQGQATGFVVRQSRSLAGSGRIQARDAARRSGDRPRAAATGRGWGRDLQAACRRNARRRRGGGHRGNRRVTPRVELPRAEPRRESAYRRGLRRRAGGRGRKLGDLDRDRRPRRGSGGFAGALHAGDSRAAWFAWVRGGCPGHARRPIRLCESSQRRAVRRSDRDLVPVLQPRVGANRSDPPLRWQRSRPGLRRGSRTRGG